MMQSGLWRKFCLLGRWLRRAVLVAVLAVICALVWFNQIGLPDFLKKPLVEKLRAHGIELQFGRLRLHPIRGLVAENVRVGGLKIPDQPTLALAEVQLQPDFFALLRGQLQIDGINLRQGRLIWRFSPTNIFALENINSELHFGTNDTWSLDNFKADFAGAKLAFAGDIVHAPEIRDWGIFHGVKTGGGSEWRKHFQQFAETLARSRAANPAQLTLIVRGDARDVNSFIVNLTVKQGKTRLQLDASKNELTQNYRWHVRGAIEPEIIRPFLTASNAVRGFNHLAFAEPLAFDANFYGRDFASFNANGSVALTNFAVRGVAADNVAADFIYTNRVLEFFNPHMARGGQMMTADEVDLDFNAKLIWFKNGFSTADPHAVARAIGPKVGRLLEPYFFAEPPTVRVNGCAPLHNVDGVRDVDDADLNFDVVHGENFQCLKLRAQTITGTVHWRGETLILTNVVAQLYNGSGNGFAFFDFSTPHEGADYQFTAHVSKLNLHLLAADLSSRSNHLEGQLSGKIIMTHGDTRDWRMLNGFGNAHLQDGLIWDIPVFGIFSPVLNTLVPGASLGSIRATDADGSFAMTNGVIYSDSLEIRSSIMRLQYNGTVDLKGNINAHVIAQPMRGIPVIGQVFNFFWWPIGQLLEYKITGTLEKPKSEPIHVPKELLMPLHPIRSLEDLFSGDNSSNTNSPPK